jgi:hypothetical protein
MTGMIETHTSVDIVTDIFTAFKALIRFSRVILIAILLIAMVTGVTRIPVTMIAAITLSATVSVTTAIPVSRISHDRSRCKR